MLVCVLAFPQASCSFLCLVLLCFGLFIWDSPYVGQASLEFTVLLPQPSEFLGLEACSTMPWFLCSSEEWRPAGRRASVSQPDSERLPCLAVSPSDGPAPPEGVLYYTLHFPKVFCITLCTSWRCFVLHYLAGGFPLVLYSFAACVICASFKVLLQLGCLQYVFWEFAFI